MDWTNILVAQALLPVWVSQNAHSQEWLCYLTTDRHSECSEELLLAYNLLHLLNSMASASNSGNTFPTAFICGV
jgi:hypothetical protein